MLTKACMFWSRFQLILQVIFLENRKSWGPTKYKKGLDRYAKVMLYKTDTKITHQQLLQLVIDTTIQAR